MINGLDMHLFILTCTIEKQNTFANVSSESFELLLILNFLDIVLPTCWNFIFLLYFPTNVVLLIDDDDDDDDDDNDDDEVCGFFKHNNLVDG